MSIDGPPPAGPRGVIGRDAEDAAVRHLGALGWSIMARNLRIGRAEVDIVALEPGRRPTVVLIEVRSHSGPGFGSPMESVDARKVHRLYGAALALSRDGHQAITSVPQSAVWRVDLVALQRDGATGWTVAAHVRGLEPP